MVIVKGPVLHTGRVGAFCCIVLFVSQVDVEVTWKVLTDSNFQPVCEPEFDLAKLRSRGHLPLVCITIPARVQPPRARG